MSAHTPGPWEISESARIYDDSPAIVWRDPDRGPDKTIATIHADDTKEIADGAIVESLSPEQEANARVIAAAPDLLSVVEALAAAVGQGGRPSPARVVALGEAARAAIAKARGK